MGLRARDARLSAPALEVRDYGTPLRVASPHRPRSSGSSRVLTGLCLLLVGFGAGWLLVSSTHRADLPPVQELPGPSRYEAGVPVGYAPTEAGAVAAAEGFLGLFGTPWVTDRQAMEAAFLATGHASARNSLAATARSVQDATAAQLLPGGADPDSLVVRVVPVAATVASRTETTATVRVWSVTVDAVDGSRPAEARWSQTRVDLLWADDDWKVLAVARDDESPVPQQAAAANVTATVPAVLRASEGQE